MSPVRTPSPLPPICIYRLLDELHSEYTSPYVTFEQRNSIFFLVKSFSILYKDHFILKTDENCGFLYYSPSNDNQKRFSAI